MLHGRVLAKRPEIRPETKAFCKYVQHLIGGKYLRPSLGGAFRKRLRPEHKWPRAGVPVCNGQFNYSLSGYSFVRIDLKLIDNQNNIF